MLNKHLTQKLYDTQSNTNLIEQLSSKFDLNQNTDLIEVYDNSHIQGTDCIGALITFGNEGFEKKRYRKFNIKNESVKGDDYGMLKEVLFRRFSKAVKRKNWRIISSRSCNGRWWKRTIFS